jgi:hypothetical protein
MNPIRKIHLARLLGIQPAVVTKLLARGLPARGDRKLDFRPSLTWIAEHGGLSRGAGRALADKARDLLDKADRRAAILATARAAKAAKAQQRRAEREAVLKRVSPPRRALNGSATVVRHTGGVEDRPGMFKASKPKAPRAAKAPPAPPVQLWSRTAPTGHDALVGELPDTLPQPPASASRARSWEAGARAVLETVARRMPAVAAAMHIQNGGDCLSAFALFSAGRGAVNRELAAIATRMGIPVKLDPHDGQPQAFAVATELDWRRAARMSHEPMDLNGWREALGADADTAAAATHGLFAVSPYYSRLLELEKCNAARGAVPEYADADGDKD